MRQQDRVRLDVAMDDAVGVQVGERVEDTLAHGGYLQLVHARLGDDVGERAAAQILHHDPELVVDQVAAVHVDNVGVLVVAHDDHFVEEELAALLLVQIHLLYGHEWR